MMDKLVAQVCFTENLGRLWASLGDYFQCPGGYKHIYYLLGFHMGLLTIGIRIVIVGKTQMDVPGNALIFKRVNKII